MHYVSINLGKTKGDQEGKNSFPRHVYANPMFPEICPILGFAIYIFARDISAKVAVDCYLEQLRKIALVNGFLQLVAKTKILLLPWV